MDEVNAVANEIYHAYRDEMQKRGVLSGAVRKYDHVFQHGKKTQGYFLQAAAACISQGLAATEYIRIAFTTLVKNMTYVTPKDLVGVRQVVEAKKYQEKAGLRVGGEWRSMRGEIVLRTQRMVPGLYRDQIELLLDPIQPFTSYFRVLYQDHVQIVLVNIYGGQAFRELSRDLKLRAYLRKIRGPQIAEFEALTATFGDQILEGTYNG